MAKKSMIAKNKRPAKFSTQAYTVANVADVHIQFIVSSIFAVFASANLPIKVKFPA